jgi:hypothetical protein
MTNNSLENGKNITNEIIEKKKMPKLWSCLVPQSDERKKSEQINKQINIRLKQDEKIYKSTYRLLLLGLFIYFLYFFFYLIEFFSRRG